MAKASPANFPRQAGSSHPAASCASVGATYPTPAAGYSVVHGLLYCHLVDDWWFPGEPILLDFQADYWPLIRNIRRCRRELKGELRRAISPRRKREIRMQRWVLAHALELFVPFAEAAGSDDDGAEYVELRDGDSSSSRH
jgi:hypothetical protein